MSKMEKCAQDQPEQSDNQSKTTVSMNETGTNLAMKKDERLVAELRSQIPDVDNIFNIHRRIGEGTFSTVFLASLKCHENVSLAKRKFFALKHLIPTSHPQRVERELKCLLEIGGVDNVVGVELCLRRRDSIAFVMPYVPHDKFHDYFDKLTAIELQAYMRNILIALNRVHSFGVIHRDVKPSNFLHDRKNQKYLLVDFGLAQNLNINKEVDSTKSLDESSTLKRKAGEIEETENCSNALNVPKRARIQYSQSYIASHNENTSQRPQSNIPSPFKTPLKQSNEISTPKTTIKSTNLDSPLTRHIKSAVVSYSINAKMENQRRTAQLSSSQASNTNPIKYNADNRRNNSGVACFCYGKPTVCNVCIIKKEVHASRSGTPGYRPPEVLLKYPNQTTAVDIWAIGVIMISILSNCYPFFKGSDDFSALAEMITVFGDDAIKKTALILGRHVCISRKKQPLHLRKLCVRLRNRSNKAKANKDENPSKESTKQIVKNCDNCQQTPTECLCAHSALNMDFTSDIYPESAYDLMAKLLAINPKNRITAEEALNHPFIMEDL